MLQSRLSRVIGLGRRLCSDASVPIQDLQPAPVDRTSVPEWARAPLVDLHGRKHDYVRVSLTERCNLRCQYCMPPEGAPLSAREALFTREELTRTVRVLAAMGVRKLRLTGGEPTLRSDLHLIIEELNSIPGITSVSMTTNGLVLTRRLPTYARAGLAALNISLDSMQPARYERMARRPGLSRVLAGVDLALQLGFPVKINVVLMKGFNDDEILDFVEYTKDRPVEVRFIEFMPFSGNSWEDSRLIPYRTALKTIVERHPELQGCTPRPNDTARVWQVPGYAGRVGFISSMTQHFCSTCNRLRITADGNLKVCLFGNAEVSLRDALRGGADDEALSKLIRVALRNKKPQHAESGADGKPADGSDRRVVNFPPFTAKRATTRSLATESQPIASPQEHRNLASVQGVSLHLDSLQSQHRSRLSTNLELQPDLSGSSRSSRLNSTSLGSKVWSLSLSSFKRNVTVRSYSTNPFSHLDSSGRARMVDVSCKRVTVRLAVAECNLIVGDELVKLLKDNALPKGDALGVARVAGVLSAKRTSELIPLCHPLPLDYVHVSIELPEEGKAVHITCEVRVTARTGAEMEALSGCSGAALALYDMCKAVDKEMVISDLRVVRKTGGKNDYPPPKPLHFPPSETSKPVDWPKETFAPINIAYM